VQEIADVVRLLAGPEGSFITSQTSGTYLT
jgi:hypothetical protein